MQPGKEPSKEIAYTIGAEEIYDKYIKDHALPRKAAGGPVWKTREEAQAYLKLIRKHVTLDPEGQLDAAVYEVELPRGWEQDTETPDVAPGEDPPMYRILKLPARLLARHSG